MKKELLVCLSLISISSTYAGTCRRKDQTQCGNSSSRVTSHSIISRYENGADDVNKVIRKLNSIENTTGERPEALASMYVKILQGIGGSRQTDSALSIVSSSERLLFYAQATPVDVAEAAYIIGQAENGADDSVKAFKAVVDATSYSGAHIIDVAMAYRETLKGFGGSRNTDNAIKAIRKMTDYSHLWYFADMSKAVFELARSENSTDDTLGNFALVLQASEYCDNLSDPTQDFNELLRSNGGARSTDDTRKAFKMAYNL